MSDAGGPKEETKKESKSGSAGADAGGEQSQSDQRYEETGEYDTQDKYKRIGNPIQWANPTGGGSQMEDNSSKHWRWVYPAGALFILLLCLYSRRRNMRKEEEEKVISTPDIRQLDTSRFSKPAYVPPPSYGQGGGDGDDEELPPPSSAVGGDFGFGNSGGFSAPPSSSSGQSSNW